MPIYTSFVDLEGFDSTTGLGALGCRCPNRDSDKRTYSGQPQLWVDGRWAIGGDLLLCGPGTAKSTSNFSLQVGSFALSGTCLLKVRSVTITVKVMTIPTTILRRNSGYSLEAGYTVAERVGISVWLRG